MIGGLLNKVKHISVHHWGVAALAAALACGQADLGRLAPDHLPELKLHFLCFAVSLAALITDAKIYGLRSFLSTRRAHLYLLGALVVTTAVYFVRDAFFLPHDLGFSVHVYVDLLMVLGLVALGFGLLRTIQDVDFLMLIIRGIAFLAACAAIAKTAFTGVSLDNGSALHIMGGPYGFYTLELMGFGATLFALLRTQNTRYLVGYAALAAFYLLTSYFSLQKAAPVAAFLGVLVSIFSLIVLRDYKHALFILLSFMVAGALFFFPSNMSDLRPSHTYVVASPIQTTNETATSTSPISTLAKIEQRNYTDDELPQGLTAHKLSYVGYELRSCYIEAWKQNPNPALLKSLDVTSCGNRITIYDNTSRLRLFLEAQKIIKRSPLLGEGVDSYRFITVRAGEFSVHTYPHNIFLNLMVRFGLIGTLILILPLGVSFVLLTRNAASTPACIALIAIGVLTMATCMVAGDFYEARMLWLLLPMTLAVIPSRNLA
ncbi:MAG TPA: hypothetical protein VIN59_01290 [Alphaproteobacteria bacterium]